MVSSIADMDSSVLAMRKKNCIWWWGYSSGDLENVEYPFSNVHYDWSVVPVAVKTMDQIQL